MFNGRDLHKFKSFTTSNWNRCAYYYIDIDDRHLPNRPIPSRPTEVDKIKINNFDFNSPLDRS